MTGDDPPVTSVHGVLSAVADPDCRTILAAVEDRMTASEIAARTDIPRSTVYRKLDRLQEAGLVETTCRFETAGKHPTEYLRSFDRLQLAIHDDGEFTVGVGDAIDDPATAADVDPPVPVVAGRTADLGDIFVSMTGTTTLVDPQHQDSLRTPLENPDTESQELDEYVAAAVTDDGLAEAIDGAETEFTMD